MGLRPLQFANPHKFEKASMNWATRKVMDVCQIRWDKMHAMVESAQLKAERAGDELLAEMRAKGAQSVNEVFEKHAEDVLQQWQALSMDMVFHYSDNTDTSTMGA